MMKIKLTLTLCLVYLWALYSLAQAGETHRHPLKVIFETDIGNDVDDALALDMIYKYADQKKIDLLAISINKDNKYSPRFVDIMNTWYGYPSVPIGIVKNGIYSEGDAHNSAETVVNFKVKDQPVFNTSQDRYTESVQMYRRILSKQEDSSVVIISVGFSTNLARLIDSSPDRFSGLTGKELVKKKVKLLSVMAGNFSEIPTHEYNVVKDIPSAAKVFNEWPTSIVVSPFEVGNSILFPAKSIENDFNWVEHHPLVIAYKSYLPMPYDRPTWDLTAALCAIEKDEDYFSTSNPGTITVDEKGYTRFRENPEGRQVILRVNQEQRERILSRFIELITTKPKVYKESKLCKQLFPSKKPVEKNIDEREFFSPRANSRPLRIIHNNLDSALIDKLAEYGYGGLVTNVSFENYLKSKENWEKFQKSIQYAIDRKGLRIWLYDEKGYPSGTAGGQVLAEYPELEAQGLAVITEKENNQGEVIINHPKGHGEVIFIRAYRKTAAELELDQMIDLMRFADKDGNLIWKAPKGDWIVYYLVQKPFYESTHATHNWAEKRRYINIMEDDATTHFIASTHEKYYKHVGRYFGKGIEAFFTDEPSLLGTYFTGYDSPRTPPVLDIPDTDFKLYPTLNWSNSFLNEFTIRRGYDLYPYLPYLFSGENDKARSVRRDYYQTITNLVAENYFEPLEKFCSRTGVASSGHLLLEENLYHHPIFEGDIMTMYRKMHFPGIDLLTAYPQKAMEWGSTVAKLASSVANYYGKRHVMSEISNAFDSDEAGIEGRIASVGVQFAYGIDIFNSYYSHDKMSKTENRQLTDYIGRVGYLLSHGKRVPQIAIYYPIESIWENTFPSMTLNPQGFDQRAVSISDNFKRLAENLIENHIDFDYMGNSEILQCKIEGGKMITPSGQKFELLIIPMATFLPTDLLDKIEQLVRNGVKILIQDKLSFKDNMPNQTNKLLSILNHTQVQNADSMEKLVALSEKMVKPKVSIDPGNKEVVMLHKCSSSVDLYFFVNTGESQTFKVKFFSSGNHVKLWNPYTGRVSLIDAKICEDEISTELTLEKWRSALISIEP